MTDIVRAKNSGFCFGVRQAIEKTEEQIEKNKDGRRIYTFGPLIHNRLVTDGLRAKGVNILDDLSQASLDDIIIVRSHGESREFWNKAKEMNLDVVDATCPFVSKIHGLVSRASEDGYNIVIVGDENHPEVQGIKGWCKGEATVIDSIEKAEKITEDNLFIVCQTTIKEELLYSVVDVFTKKIRYSP